MAAAKKVKPSRVRSRFCWEISPGGRVMVYDNDFGYDAALRITGDFIDEHSWQYAAAVCRALNAADIPVAPKNYGSEADGKVES
jgi:hypothetical protein